MHSVETHPVYAVAARAKLRWEGGGGLGGVPPEGRGDLPQQKFFEISTPENLILHHSGTEKLVFIL